jgi:TetR/AcrR family tetracycline transcriptional repressor
MKNDVNPSRPRRRRGSVSRDEIVDAALALANEVGLAGLTMPVLAARVGCGVMTLYGYVRSKDELLGAIAQRGLADLQLPRPLPTNPAGVLETWGRALRATLLRNPSLPVIFMDQPVVGPGIFGGVEALLRALSNAGYPADQGVRAIYGVLIYTVGFVGWEVPRTHRQSPAAYASRWRQVAATLPTSDYPLSMATLDVLVDVAGDRQFDLGLVALCQALSQGAPL